MSATIHITMYRSREFNGTRGRRAALFFTARAASSGCQHNFQGCRRAVSWNGLRRRHTHTHTHARDTCAVTPHRPRAPSFSKETISNAEFIATTLH